MTETETYLSRHLVVELEEAIASARVVNLIGPRQVGKTTLVRDLFGHGRFITLDDAAVLSAIEADPEGQLASLMQDLGQAPLIIDEAQRSKKLALAIKRVVDTDRRKGQFVLTGSSNIFTTTDVADSLAGRMRTLKLWPLSVAEIKSAPVSRLVDWSMQKILGSGRYLIQSRSQEANISILFWPEGFQKQEHFPCDRGNAGIAITSMPWSSGMSLTLCQSESRMLCEF